MDRRSIAYPVTDASEKASARTGEEAQPTDAPHSSRSQTPPAGRPRTASRTNDVLQPIPSVSTGSRPTLLLASPVASPCPSSSGVFAPTPSTSRHREPTTSQRFVRASSVPLPLRENSPPRSSTMPFLPSHGARARMNLETSGRQESKIQDRKSKRKMVDAARQVAAVFDSMPSPTRPMRPSLSSFPLFDDHRPPKARGPLQLHHLLALHHVNLPRPPILVGPFTGLLSSSRYDLATATSISHGSVSVPSLSPPVTRATLAELDLTEVLRNPQLRHDITFDSTLMFRPNYDGERGQKKRQTADRYWTAVARELGTGCRCTAYTGNTLLGCVCDPTSGPRSVAFRLPSRVPMLIEELKAILLSIVPAPTLSNIANSSPAAQVTHRAAAALVEEALDAELIVQQLQHGVFNMVNLARFVGQTLKLHCAPMRDAAVDKMVLAMAGPTTTTGLRMCFELLELMKLDISNHQVRSLRHCLLDTTVDFELRSFAETILHRSRRRPEGYAGCIANTRAWLLTQLSPDALSAYAVERAVRNGVVSIAVDGKSSRDLPESLQFDAARLLRAHIETTDLTIVYTLVMLFRQLRQPSTRVGEDVLKRELDAIITDGLSSSYSATTSTPSSAHGIRKLGNDRWRAASLSSALLHLATRIDGHAPPSARTLQLVDAWGQRHVRADSPLYQALQTRVRQSLLGIVQTHFDAWHSRTDATASTASSSVPLEAIVATGIRPVQHGVVAAFGVQPAQMARSARKRSRSPTESESPRKRQRSITDVDVLLVTSGLSLFAPELRALGERLARVAAFNHRTFAAFYARLVNDPCAAIL